MRSERRSRARSALRSSCADVGMESPHSCFAISESFCSWSIVLLGARRARLSRLMPNQMSPAPTMSVARATVRLAVVQEKPKATRPVTAACSSSTIVAISKSAPAPISAADSAVNVSFSDISARSSCSSVWMSVAISFSASPAMSTTPLSFERAGRRRTVTSLDVESAAIARSRDAAQAARRDNGNCVFWFRGDGNVRGSAPKIAIIVEVRENRVGSCRLHHRKQPFQHRVNGARGVPHVKIDGVERLAQMPLGVVIQTAAEEALVAVGDGPFDDVVEDAIIKIEVEGDGVIKPDILVTDSVALHRAKTESDNVVVLPPDEETDLFRHAPADLAEKFLGEFLELKR